MISKKFKGLFLVQYSYLKSFRDQLYYRTLIDKIFLIGDLVCYNMV